MFGSMCFFFFFKYMGVCYVVDAFRIQEKVSDGLELELQVVVSCHEGADT